MILARKPEWLFFAASQLAPEVVLDRSFSFNSCAPPPSLLMFPNGQGSYTPLFVALQMVDFKISAVVTVLSDFHVPEKSVQVWGLGSWTDELANLM